jgi:Zn-dependent peptidase ImmA (M78 family)
MVVLDSLPNANPVARLRAAAGGATGMESALRIVVAQLLDGLEFPATDLQAVAERMNVRLELRRGLPVSAMLTRDDRGFKVICAAEQARGRQRFTIAHELGHAVLETHGLGEPPRSGRAVETLCDRFAAELLMPSSMFERELRDGISLERLISLQRRYGTSLRATSIRCSQMTPMEIYVADSRDLLWTTGNAARYDGFLRSLVARLVDTEQRLVRKVNLIRDGAPCEDWRLEADLLKGSRDVVLLLTPANQPADRDQGRLLGGPSAARDRRAAAATRNSGRQ